MKRNVKIINVGLRVYFKGKLFSELSRQVRFYLNSNHSNEMDKFGHLHRKQKVSDRASLHRPSRPRPGPPPCPRLLTVCVSEADAAAPHAAPPHCPRQQGLCAHKTRGQTSGNIESFSFLSSHPPPPSSSLFLRPPPPPPPPPILLAPPNTDNFCLTQK